jgi:bifunctional DNA-binding transcriptional regulator/antitoxin component of YhaV-PrlF toxin-antitoxin module
MGNVKELSVDDKGRLQLPKDIRKKLGINGRGKVKVIITAPMPREEFIEYMDGFIKGGDPPVDPLRLKKIGG